MSATLGVLCPGSMYFFCGHIIPVIASAIFGVLCPGSILRVYNTRHYECVVSQIGFPFLYPKAYYNFSKHQYYVPCVLVEQLPCLSPSPLLPQGRRHAFVGGIEAPPRASFSPVAGNSSAAEEISAEINVFRVWVLGVQGN